MGSRTPRLLVLLAALLLLQACGSLQAASTARSPTPAPATPSPGEATRVSTVRPAEPSPTPSDTGPVPTTEWLSAAPAQFGTGDPIQLDEIHMTDAANGWGVSGMSVLATSDGGRTWREATPPQRFPPGTNVEAFAHFYDRQTGWVIFSVDHQILPEASVWRTTDGGRTWSAGEPLLAQVYGEVMWGEYASIDSQNVWLMLRSVTLGAGVHHAHELFRTQDGGATWTSLDGEISDDYTGMVFADTDVGWLTWQTTGAYAPAPPDFGTTADGGMTWETRSLPPPPNQPGLFDQYAYCESYQPVLLSARSVRLLVGCFDGASPPKEFAGYLYASEDGGATWKTYALPDRAMANESQLIYFDDATALLLGREIYRSSDGGASWSHVKTVSWDGQFSFIDPQRGWAVATDGLEVALVATVNGGGSWAEIKPRIAE